MYKHGIEVTEKSTSLKSPLSTQYAVQVVFGTAPIYLTENPEAAVNYPMLIRNFDEAKEKLGYLDNWKHYTLCQSMYASFYLFQVSPVIFVNVLDPKKHVKELTQQTYPLNEHQATLQTAGILLDELVVQVSQEEGRTGTAKAGKSRAGGGMIVLERDKDYLATFNDSGHLILTMLSTGNGYQAVEAVVSGKMLAPELVTERDIIGAYDLETGQESGLEVLRQVYPRYGIVPGFLLAPGWSENPNIGAALQSKCEDISGVFRSMCLLDLDTSLAKKYTDCELTKQNVGYDEKHSIVLWPRLTMEGKQYCYSAVYGAMASYNTVTNGDIPYQYPSNKELNVDGAVLEDGTEICLDQVQAGILNGAGVVTALRDLSWKSYGNNTGCYPENTDPKDRWIGCRRMFDYVSNYFTVTYRQKLDSNMNRRTIDDIVNSFNIWGNSLVASGVCAGLYAEYLSSENTVDDVLAGHLKLHIYFAPYTPAEYINVVMEFDAAALESTFEEE